MKPRKYSVIDRGKWCQHIMSKKQSLNEQKRALSAASDGLYANRTLLTVELEIDC